ncbi:MAG: GIY-YIG nuclease family protein [Clostridia bacterium]|nr:GIY-YIG nuclease family protein [Clostridia bacterium]MBP3371144.1 GIY-YIG nuclease family protein [Clostridia bacterium]
MYYVYMMTNKSNQVLYIGVTNNLQRRVFEHKNQLVEGFTQMYNVHKLVWFEQTSDVRSAIAREKQLKGWSRKKKDWLVEQMNPTWGDLADNWYEE